MVSSNQQEIEGVLGSIFSGAGGYMNSISKTNPQAAALAAVYNVTGGLLTGLSTLPADGQSPVSSVGGYAASYLAGGLIALVFGEGLLPIGAAIVAGYLAGKVASDKLQAMMDFFDNHATSPLVLDLGGGNGIELSSLATSKALFNLDNGQFIYHTAWVKPADGLLCIDKNGDGHITSGAELFGNASSGGTYTDGFAALAAYDSNHNGVITANDTQFSKLLIWQDANQNGFSEVSELKHLSDYGITIISLNDTPSNTINAGNTISSTSTFVMNGQTRTIADAWFSQDKTTSFFVPDDTFHFDTTVQDLPNLRGHGVVKDLWFAMSEDATLKTMVNDLTHTGFTNFHMADFSHAVEAVLFRWAGVENVDPASRPETFADARVVEAWEALAGRTYTAYPTVANGAQVTEAWHALVTEESIKLLSSIVNLPAQHATGIVFDEIQAAINAGATAESLSTQHYIDRLNEELGNVQATVTNHPEYGLVKNFFYDYTSDTLSPVSGNAATDFSAMIGAIASHQPTATLDKPITGTICCQPSIWSRRIIM